jgi:predicted DNA-binding protein
MKVKVNFTIDEEIRDLLHYVSKRDERNKSKIVNNALKKYLTQDKKDE